MGMLHFLLFFSLMAFLLYESYMCVLQGYLSTERCPSKMGEHNRFTRSTSLKLLLNVHIKFSEFVVLWSCIRMVITCLSRFYLSRMIGNSFTLPWEEVRNSTGHWKAIQEFKNSPSVDRIFLRQINSNVFFLKKFTPNFLLWDFLSVEVHSDTSTWTHMHICVVPQISCL